MIRYHDGAGGGNQFNWIAERIYVLQVNRAAGGGDADWGTFIIYSISVASCGGVDF